MSFKTLLLLVCVFVLYGCGDSSSSNGASSKPKHAVIDSVTKPTVVPRSIRGSGVLWKPVAEGDGKLVVLTPSSFKQLPVSIIDYKTSRILAGGRFIGRTNGNRPTYRFVVAGRAFPTRVVLKIGSAYYLIPNSANRQE